MAFRATNHVASEINFRVNLLTLNPSVRQSSRLNVWPTRQYTKKLSDELSMVAKCEMYISECMRNGGAKGLLQNEENKV